MFQSHHGSVVMAVRTIDQNCGGMMERLENDGQIVVVQTHDGSEEWLPIQEVVRDLRPN